MTKTSIFDQNKLIKIVKILLLTGTVLAAIKMLFLNYSMDEEYQVVMAYRNVIGDHLFSQMWEPHQTSVFLCAIGIRVYLAVTHTTTGIVIFLRVMGTIIHLGISVYCFKVMRRYLSPDYSFYLSLIYFNTIPKLIQIPEFGIMQVWFYTLSILFFMEYYHHESKRNKYLIFAGIVMSLEVLSYPSSIILFPFLQVMIMIMSGKRKWKDLFLFSGTCFLSGCIYLLCLLRNLSAEKLFRNIRNIVNSDSTHHFNMAFKVKNAIMDLGIISLHIVVILIISYIVVFLWKKKKGQVLFTDNAPTIYYVANLAVMLSCLVQLGYWIILNTGYEYLNLHICMTIFVSPVFLSHLKGDEKKILGFGIAGAVVSLVAVVWLTDLGLIHSIPHGFMGALLGLVTIIIVCQKQLPKMQRPLCYLLVAVWCFTAIMGKGYTLRGSQHYNNVFQTRGIIKYGPAIGTFSDYMGAHIYNSDYKMWKKWIGTNRNVLVVSNSVMSVSTTQYMFSQSNICHFSIVDPTTYDEKLLKYWKLYPEKKPDVIVVDCWFGELQLAKDSWIMNYIEKDFGYTQAIDGEYIRIYKRN